MPKCGMGSSSSIPAGAPWWWMRIWRKPSKPARSTPLGWTWYPASPSPRTIPFYRPPIALSPPHRLGAPGKPATAHGHCGGKLRGLPPGRPPEPGTALSHAHPFLYRHPSPGRPYPGQPFANPAGISDSLLARLKRREQHLPQRPKAYTTARPLAGDLVQVQIGDDPVKRAAPMAFPLSILYEDPDILVLNKPSGVAVHASTRSPGELTLENALSYYLPPDAAPHPVSRLDRGTTGVMAWAKNGYMHHRLQALSIPRPSPSPTWPFAGQPAPNPWPHPPAHRLCPRLPLPAGCCPSGPGRPYGIPPFRPPWHPIPGAAAAPYRPHPSAAGPYGRPGLPPPGGLALWPARPPYIPARLHANQLSFLHPLTGTAVTVYAPMPQDMLACWQAALA